MKTKPPLRHRLHEGDCLLDSTTTSPTYTTAVSKKGTCTKAAKLPIFVNNRAFSAYHELRLVDTRYLHKVDTIPCSKRSFLWLCALGIGNAEGNNSQSLGRRAIPLQWRTDRDRRSDRVRHCVGSAWRVPGYQLFLSGANPDRSHWALDFLWNIPFPDHTAVSILRSTWSHSRHVSAITGIPNTDVSRPLDASKSASKDSSQCTHFIVISIGSTNCR